jgi:hypothetical protein
VIGTSSTESVLCSTCRLCRQTSVLLIPPLAQRVCCVCVNDDQPMTPYDSVSLCLDNGHRIHVSCAIKMRSQACPLCRGGGA